MKTLLKSRYTLLCSIIAFACLVAAFVVFKSEAAKTPTTGASVRAAVRGRPFLNLRDGYALKGTDASDAAFGAAGNARPLTLAAADFDLDGAPDLLSGYAAGGQGLITFRRGNIDAFAPSDPAIFQAIQQGQMPDSLLPDTRSFSLPEAPDFMLAGDFDRDGMRDILTAARGGGLYFLKGDGAGNLSAPAHVKLPGTVTALAAGHFGRGDGWTDVTVGVNNAQGGASALVFTNGLSSASESFALPAEASALALGRLDADLNFDLAVATGSAVEIIHGSSARARSPKGIGGALKTDGQARSEHIELSSSARALALGVFVWNRDNRETMAVLTEDGAVRLLQPADLDMRPFTPAEIEANKLLVDQDEEQARTAALIPAWRPSAANAWQVVGQLGAAAPVAAGANGQALLMSSFMTYGESADLIVLNAGARQLNIVRGVGAQLRDEKAGQAVPLGALQQAAALNVAGTPVAALEMPRQVNGERALVVLAQESLVPAVIIAAPLATITVDRTDDNAGASACTAAGNDCSLRGAVTFANANAGTTISVPANTYNLTLGTCGDDANTGGDLDMTTSGTAVVGAGAATTIVKQTVNDGVFHTNPPATGSPTYSFTGLTIRDGLKDNACAVPRAGGGIVFAGSVTTSSVTSCIFINNHLTASVNANGGAMTQSAGASGDAGDVTVTGCTFMGNKTDTGVGGAYRLSGGTGTASLNMTNCTFDTNEATTNEGGGMFLTSTTNGSYTISKSKYLNNVAITQGSASQQGGGGIQKSNGALTINFSRFRGNTVGAGAIASGLKLGGNDNVDATNNWWGCNLDPQSAGAAAAGCDTVGKPSSITFTITSLPQLVLKNTANPAPIVTGQDTTLTASVNSNSSNQDVSANVDVLLGLPLAFSNPVRGALSGAGTIIQTSGGGKGTATATFRASAAGAGAADATVDSAIGTANFTINKADTTSTITSDTPDPTVSGQSFTVNFSLAVNAPGSNNPTVPTGNVTVTADTGEQCTGAINSATPATGSCSITVFHAGNRTLTAAYQGDANFNVSPASSPATAHTVNKADTTTTITMDDPDPSVTNQSVTVNYSIAVTAPGSAQAGNPTGMVVVTDNGNTFCTGAVTGTGSCSAPLTSAGSHMFVATYQGDANYNASPASSPATAHTVNKADTTTSILTDTPDPTTRGQSFTVTYSLAVTAPGSNSPTAPTGNVMVTDGVDSCTGTVAAGQCNLILFTIGNRSITATYQGDSNFNASPASAGAAHTVNKNNTTTGVQSSKNPSDVGDNVTFTATITPTFGADVPGGTVQFRDGPTGTGTPIGAPATVTNGVATVQTNALTAGTHTITADYSGDANLNASTVALTGGQTVIAATPTSNGNVLITEFRFRGARTPSGAQDEFIELYNNTNAPLVVPSSGWTLRSVDTLGTTATVFSVPPGTTIPARAHFLITNNTPSVGFSLGGYPAGAATVGTGNGQYTGIDIGDGGGVALYNSGTLFDVTTQLDAVGFTTTPNTLYREGAGLAPAGGVTADGEYSFLRKLTSGLPQDTGDNAADFVFVSTTGGSFSGTQSTLGAPGPENLASPLQRNATIKATLIDPQAASTATPNRVRDFTPVTNGPSGTLTIRRKFTNNTGAPVTRLRFRVVDITTTPVPAGTADFRVLTSTTATVTITGGSMVTVQGLTLETPPAQTSGGGLNSTLAAGTVTVGTPIANGASINVHFQLGVQQAGSFRFFINVEALP
ncbi:MAG: Ig-like domain repeat protein [Pyrinomonadaceae bacterium]